MLELDELNAIVEMVQNGLDVFASAPGRALARASRESPGNRPGAIGRSTESSCSNATPGARTGAAVVLSQRH